MSLLTPPRIELEPPGVPSSGDPETAGGPAGRAPAADQPAPTGHPAPAPSHEVGAMFDRIAPRYDAMNSVMSGFQEPRWRRTVVAATGLGPGMAAIDVATGTGKLAGSLADRVGPFGRVVGIDVSRGMLERARDAGADAPWLEFLEADALELPAMAGSFDAATIAFGMRSLTDLERGFAEMARVVTRRPGRLPRDRAAAFGDGPAGPSVVRARGAADRAPVGPRGGVSLPRRRRPGLPVAGACRRAHAPGRAGRRWLELADARPGHDPRRDATGGGLGRVTGRESCRSAPAGAMIGRAPRLSPPVIIDDLMGRRDRSHARDPSRATFRAG